MMRKKKRELTEAEEAWLCNLAGMMEVIATLKPPCYVCGGESATVAVWKPGRSDREAMGLAPENNLVAVPVPLCGICAVSPETKDKIGESIRQSESILNAGGMQLLAGPAPVMKHGEN